MAESRTAPPKALTFPETHLHVEPWIDPLVDALGHDPRSQYVEQYWVAILGPSATLLIRRLAAQLDVAKTGFVIEPSQWAVEMGLGVRGGKNSPFWRSLDRLARFGATRRAGKHLAVRRKLPPLTLRQTDRLPPALAERHRAYLATTVAASDALSSAPAMAEADQPQ